jgi:lipoprotein NlpD
MAALLLAVGGCALVEQQPVAVTTATGARPADAVAARVSRRRGDERPDAYVVQRGDTLYAIALDFGFDYRELAAWNELADPSRILVGQRLRFTPPQKDVAPEVKSLPAAAIVPAEPLGQPAAASAIPSADAGPAPKVTVLSEPRATTVPYSDQALARAAPSAAPAAARPTQTAAAPAAPTAPVAAPAGIPPPDKASAEDDEVLDWAWPVRGDILYRFGDTGRLKGIGISGRMGQPVSAAAAGKVVYSGTGLRGYGRLVIVKHNETYLSVYAHNSALAVKEGDAVKRGQRIADMGDTDTSRVSLHFEVRRFGKPIDPLGRLPAP